MRQVIVGAVAATLAVGVVTRAETLQIDGSTTVGPIADAFAEYFKSIEPDLAITVKKTGSGDGAAALIDGRCDIATMSRFMKPEEFEKAVANKVLPVAHVVAMDGVCVAVHPSNPVKALTSAQVRDIYTGKITNWKQVGGSDTPIVVISRDTSSGTYETFESLVMKKQPMAAGVEYVNANPQAQSRVRTTPGAIGSTSTNSGCMAPWAMSRRWNSSSAGWLSIRCGATRMETMLKVVIPAAHSGIIAAVVLGMMRAIGETMVVWMASGNATQIPHPWWDVSQSIRTMTATIAGGMGESPEGSQHRGALFAIGVLLLILTFGLNLVSEYFLARAKKAAGRS